MRKARGKRLREKRPRCTGSIFQLKDSHNWWLKYYRNGAAVRESSGTDSKCKAEKLLQQRLGEVATGSFIEPTDRKVMVDEMYQALLNDYRNNGRASLQGAEQRWEDRLKESSGEKGSSRHYRLAEQICCLLL